MSIKNDIINPKLTYISLFSCAGIGCYGFKQEDFSCIATVELLEKRLNIQKLNQKCKYDTGYICGDIRTEESKNAIFSEIKRWQKKEKLKEVDVVVATPPCQGISVVNHKKNKSDINRNSLVVESVEIVQSIRPKVFIFENVMAFQKTLCITKDESIKPIGEFIKETLGKDYIISGRILNFMNYGANSSRTRTLVIGVHKKYKDSITPYDLFPDYQKEKTLKEVIWGLPPLEWGDICPDDFYHAFRIYDSSMRCWIHDLKEGEGAFSNTDPAKRPHKLVNGVIVPNIEKNRDKYTRQRWNRFVQCVNTRNDQLAAQNTVHPTEDRVFSIREIMLMMNVPSTFKWFKEDLLQLNTLSEEEKKKLYKLNEINIRQCLGEAVPTIIMRQIAHKIKKLFGHKSYTSLEVNRIIELYKLENSNNLKNFLLDNPERLDVPVLMRITELCNAKREENSAFYTNKFLVNEIMNTLPDFNLEILRILEPSVGAGSFIPFLLVRYAYVPKVIIDVVDIDPNSIENLKLIIGKLHVPSNFVINYICQDFLLYDEKNTYNLSIGNPPFAKIKKVTDEIKYVLFNNVNQETKDISEIFLEKCLRMSDNVALVLNKNILSSGEYKSTRKLLSGMNIGSIIDFGRYGFTGVSIETISLFISPKQKPANTRIINLKYDKIYNQKQDYITDPTYPYFIIYRDGYFDDIANKLKFNVFDVFRDRQISKAITSVNKTSNDDLWVIKAKNLKDDGSGIIHIEGYDVYLKSKVAEQLSISKYIGNKNVYLTPNMTYNPRIICNLENVVPDGSVAVLIPKSNFRLSKDQMDFFTTPEYRKFYSIARNLSTQSINVDKSSVFFYGILRNDD